MGKTTLAQPPAGQEEAIINLLDQEEIGNNYRMDWHKYLHGRLCLLWRSVCLWDRSANLIEEQSGKAKRVNSDV